MSIQDNVNELLNTAEKHDKQINELYALVESLKGGIIKLAADVGISLDFTNCKQQDPAPSAHKAPASGSTPNTPPPASKAAPSYEMQGKAPDKRALNLGNQLTDLKNG